MQVYLYVNASKKVVGCVMLQSIESACPSIPAEDTAASTADSSAGELELRRLPICSQPRFMGTSAVSGSGVGHRLRTGIFPSAGCSPSNTQVSITMCKLCQSVLCMGGRSAFEMHFCSIFQDTTQWTNVSDSGLRLRGAECC